VLAGTLHPKTGDTIKNPNKLFLQKTLGICVVAQIEKGY
jgi:hypothetical protein